MPSIQAFRQKVINRGYYLSAHAEEEMWADALERTDVERAILNGRMNCEFCSGETASKKVRKHHWLRGKLYVVENVDAEVCGECGERYYHARTLDAIDKLLQGDHEVKESLEVEVVSL